MNTEPTPTPQPAPEVHTPKLPPIPAQTNTGKVSPIPPPVVQPVVKEDPTWWRKGAIPFIVLILAAAAADLYWPHSFSAGVGVGAGIAGLLLSVAIVLLRKDLSKGEIAFLLGMGIVNCVALLVSGNPLNYLIGLIVPFFIISMPTDKAEPDKQKVSYRTWWGYWTAHRPKNKEARKRAWRQIMPMLISILAAVALFIGFLTIFASGNPIVEIVWNWIVTKWNDLLEFLNISWDFVDHIILWFVGIVIFGLYTHKRNYFAPLPPVPARATESTTMLPHLPLFSLIGINMAFLVATSTDIAYLWFKNIPEGISQTAYLHNGADSIIWAAVLASSILIILFRRNGIARQSIATKIAGYLLVLQTFLLAASVYMRLFYQIADYGFTFRRILAGEFMLLGLAGLVVLVLYMACEGRFWRSAKICFGTMALMLIAGGIITPSRLAATLNMHYMDSNPHWKFSSMDYEYGRFDQIGNLAFAEMIYRQSPNGYMARGLQNAARNIVYRYESDSWTNFTLNDYYDYPTAKRILEDKEIEETSYTY